MINDFGKQRACLNERMRYWHPLILTAGADSPRHMARDPLGQHRGHYCRSAGTPNTIRGTLHYLDALTAAFPLGLVG